MRATQLIIWIGVGVGLVMFNQRDAQALTAGELRQRCATAIRMTDQGRSETSNAVESYDAGYCTGFMRGWFSGIFKGVMAGYGKGYVDHAIRKRGEKMPLPWVFCVPDNVTGDQISRIFVLGAEQHPERLHENAGDIFADVLRRAFPCETAQPARR